MELYDITTFECSKIITQCYSTSFTLGIKTLHKRFHYPIYGIYGFVRYADEIVDTFHNSNKSALLAQFKKDAYTAIQEKISLNPVLHAFQTIVNQYNIDLDLIEAFLKSMEMDLCENTYTPQAYQKYIYGSAEAVGLMCLKTFCEGDELLYEKLKPSACSLGAAFQKVNFLRDIKSDYCERGRMYFPQVNFDNFDEKAKENIEADIQKDFEHAYQGILQLPKDARRGVYLAYSYYVSLFEKIKKLSATKIMNERVRVPNQKKMSILLQTYIKDKFNIL